jgi:hypothetical protein
MVRGYPTSGVRVRVPHICPCLADVGLRFAINS